MEIAGKLKICDRCKSQVFLKLKGKKANFIDGEYSTYGEFENEPDGWEYIHGIGALCPNCSKEYTDFLNSFLNKDDGNNLDKGE